MGVKLPRETLLAIFKEFPVKMRDSKNIYSLDILLAAGKKAMTGNQLKKDPLTMTGGNQCTMNAQFRESWSVWFEGNRRS